jgi:[ribosomal protein S5]-alanine N-acetyltransferase
MTARLVMRSPRESDAPAYSAIMSNPLNIEHDPENNAPKDPTVEAYEKRIAELVEGNEKGEKALTCIVLKNPDGTEGPVIGMGGYPYLVHNADGRPGNTGALVDSAYWRKGYATEALVRSLDYGFETLGFEVIEQTTQEANAGYNALMKYMGFDAFGERRWSDEMKVWEMNYPVTREQWENIKRNLPVKYLG